LCQNTYQRYCHAVIQRNDLRTDEQKTTAEQRLGVQFSPEYREYLSAYGAASVFGHELTGICTLSRLNVIEVTISERVDNPSVPLNWYVIEETHIDSIVIWQTETGEIFQSIPNMPPLKLCDSLSEYIDL
jgi:hypothetical protein